MQNSLCDLSGKSVDLRAKCEVRSIESSIGPVILKFGVNDCGSQPLRGSILLATQFLEEANIRYVFRVMDLEGIGGKRSTCCRLSSGTCHAPSSHGDKSK